MVPNFQRWHDTGRSFQHRGHAIFYQEGGAETGADTALLLIHGFPTGSWAWHRVWQPLCARFPRVIAADLLGYGFSAKPRTNVYSSFDQAELLEALLAQQGVRRVHLLAHDYGNTVTQELLARDETRRRQSDSALAIDSACLLNGGLFPEAHRPRLIQRLLTTPLGPFIGRLVSERQFNRSLAAIFGPRTQPSTELLQEFWKLVNHNDGARVVHRLISYMRERWQHRSRWVGALQRTRVPLRMINGPEDPVSGAHIVERYRELAPNPDVVLLPGIGHYPQLEDPEGMLRAFFDFQDRLAGCVQ